MCIWIRHDKCAFSTPISLWTDRVFKKMKQFSNFCRRLYSIAAPYKVTLQIFGFLSYLVKGIKNAESQCSVIIWSFLVLNEEVSLEIKSHMHALIPGIHVLWSFQEMKCWCTLTLCKVSTPERLLSSALLIKYGNIWCWWRVRGHFILLPPPTPPLSGIMSLPHWLSFLDGRPCSMGIMNATALARRNPWIRPYECRTR